MYVRSEFGVFNKVAKKVDGWYILEDGNGVKKDSVEVADTPQELIRDYDFITYKIRINNLVTNSIPLCVMGRFDDKIVLYANMGQTIFLEQITTIYTPNANGNYIKQWEENNESNI